MNNVDYKLLSRLAFEKRNPNAQFELAKKYKEGIDIKQNMSTARLLLLMAARKRYQHAVWTIAYNYQSGDWGFPIDRLKSSYWNEQLLMTLQEDTRNNEKHTESLSVHAQDNLNILAFATKQ